jgi:transaldolase / glucose-6-phosphate isomerase
VTEALQPVTASIPGPLRAAVKERVALLAEQQVPDRLRRGDPTIWGPPGAPEVANRLGWLTIAQRMMERRAEFEEFAAEVAADGIEDAVVLGMGGSSLAPEVLRRTFPSRDDRPTLHVLDSTDAEEIAAVQDAVDPQRTLFIVSSKSGGTIEPNSLFAHFHSLVGDGANFAAITDPGTSLQTLAERNRFRAVFAGDPDIGGRYSALSPFGLVPAALAGIDISQLLEGAGAAWDTALDSDDWEDGNTAGVDAACWLGAALSALAGAGRDKLTFAISPTLPGLGLWLEQLVAESTGKQGRGILPVAEEPPGEAAAYGNDRVFAHLSDSSSPQPQTQDRMEALVEAGHPVITIPTGGPSDLGRVFLLAELAVAVAGWGLQINPFDQPNVQQAKDATNKVLAGFAESGELPKVTDDPTTALRSLLLGAEPPEYVALMAYVRPSREFDLAAAELREAVREANRATTTFGYGPRFLHSTGQFHKGGPRIGRFLQIIHDGPQEVGIPGAPYDFTTLKNAQATGDLQTLRSLGRPAERVRLTGDDPAGALRSLTATIKEGT